VPLVSP